MVNPRGYKQLPPPCTVASVSPQAPAPHVAPRQPAITEKVSSYMFTKTDFNIPC